MNIQYPHQTNDPSLLRKEIDAIIDSVFDGIWITDGQGITVRINRALEKIANLKNSEVVGRHVLDVRDEGKFALSVNMKALEEGKPVTLLDEYSTGKRCLTSSVPVFNDKGEIWRAVAIVRDMTELENLQQELLVAQEQARHFQDKIIELEKEQQLGTDFVGNSPTFRKVIATIRRLAKVDSTTIILGETGTGKSLVAQAIHNLSPRSKEPFIKVNCGAIPENLIESELFGYEKGAFTGAQKEGKPGMFELAQGGTIFLDEIGELPLLLQVKLLQAVEEQCVFRVGGTKPVHLNVRIIAATNRNLEEMVANRTFREDLYYRLKVLSIILPPLRERREDITPLALYFLKVFNQKMVLSKELSIDAIDYLVRHNWPGNVRELRTVIEHLIIMTDSNLITPDDLPLNLRQSMIEVNLGDQPFPLKQAVHDLEKKLLTKAIQKYQNSYKVAEILKINQSTVIRKAQKYGISFNEITKLNGK
ncbi:sigma-54 interaction domain-containing protein [Desulforamulus aeronauticus]|uniref:HTH-type transcriptional regulatory protein TyrR n=1 Tax=Desulforamulus aeronauticus DSM 10349 TaxID=1121421 RepID=A0A1M6UEW0_9FIRM|nr:sigma 54-interacting transcriptional regulator [Desulforamulus aeronauticus]SHK67782.1 PAS domain S-box-containing protein [Desulforamulus aeronauticus DSM 10349]